MKEVDAAAKTVQKEAVRKEVVKTARRLAEMLKTARHNGGYFDRTEEEGARLCTRAGWFTCQFEQEVCPSLHSINPYGSRESRIVFSTWNLDHRIEKKRTIIPALLDALQSHKSCDVNLLYFYRLYNVQYNACVLDDGVFPMLFVMYILIEQNHEFPERGEAAVD